ncbi:MAG: hypothetical protein J6H18_00260 [Lachnospiraceae bacterium]|nr:hypothetical protein [Lachnospiraceae bacterium]
MLIYQESHALETTDFNMFLRLRPARLLELVQLVSGRHAQILGMGEETLQRLNLAWVVVRQKLEILRMPRWGESLCFTTWPGRGLHGLFPRYMEITSPEGEVFVRLCFLWVIMDKEKRELVHPLQYGLDMPAAPKEALMPLPRLPKELLPLYRQDSFTVPYGYIDVLGHMNNTRYLEMAENLIPAPREGKILQEAIIEFTHELRLGETMQLEIGREGDSYTVKGTRDQQDIITLCLRYA